MNLAVVYSGRGEGVCLVCACVCGGVGCGLVWHMSM